MEVGLCANPEHYTCSGRTPCVEGLTSGIKGFPYRLLTAAYVLGSLGWEFSVVDTGKALSLIQFSPDTLLRRRVFISASQLNLHSSNVGV